MIGTSCGIRSNFLLDCVSWGERIISIRQLLVFIFAISIIARSFPLTSIPITFLHLSQPPLPPPQRRRLAERLVCSALLAQRSHTGILRTQNLEVVCTKIVGLAGLSTMAVSIKLMLNRASSLYPLKTARKPKKRLRNALARQLGRNSR